jgi:predicted CoA-binding protein
MRTNPDAEQIRALLHGAKNIAVVGLSDKPYRTSNAIALALQQFGYRIFPVNPNLDGLVLGENPYSSVSEIEEPVDIVNVFRRGETVVPVAEDAVAAGARALWMQLGVVNDEAHDLAAENGLTVVMDRCIKVDYAALIGPGPGR